MPLYNRLSHVTFNLSQLYAHFYCNKDTWVNASKITVIEDICNVSEHVINLSARCLQHVQICRQQFCTIFLWFRVRRFRAAIYHVGAISWMDRREEWLRRNGNLFPTFSLKCTIFIYPAGNANEIFQCGIDHKCLFNYYSQLNFNNIIIIIIT